MTEPELTDRAERAAASLVARLELGGLEDIDRALIFRALTLGWGSGYQAGYAEGIEYAAGSLQAVLNGRPS